MDNRIKIGYRISPEAVLKLQVAAKACDPKMSMERCLDYLILNGRYPEGVKKSLKSMIDSIGKQW